MSSVHDRTLRDKAGTSMAACVRRIVRTYRLATPEHIINGTRWYDDAARTAASVADAGSIDTDRAAVILAHLSPRTTWQRTIMAAHQVVTTRTADAVLGRNVTAALNALDASDPWQTFSPAARKTRAFARNILGDTNVVTVDVWAMRVLMGVGWGDTWRTGADHGLDRILSRAGVYQAAEAAYRAAGRLLGVAPTSAQAVTWVVARNTAS